MANEEPKAGCLKRALGCAGLVIAGSVTVVFMIGVLEALFGDDKKAPAASVKPVPSAAVRAPEVTREPEKPKPRITCVLGQKSGDGDVPVLPTEAGYDEFMKIMASSEDGHARDIVFRSNGGFWVTKGTKCMFVDAGLVTTEVRVLEGPHQGKKGFVPTEWATGG